MTWDGLFEADIPHGWTAHASEGVIEILPPAPVGAIHITVLRRSRVRIVEDGEAAALLRKFAARYGYDRQGDEVWSTDSLSTEAPDVRESNERVSDVRVVVWSERAVVATYLRMVTIELSAARDWRSSQASALRAIRRGSKSSPRRAFANVPTRVTPARMISRQRL